MLQDYINNSLFFRHKSGVGLIVLLALLFLIGACTQDENGAPSLVEISSDHMVLILKNQSEEFSPGAANQVVRALDYAKIPYLTIDLGIISRELNIPKSVKSLVVTTQSVAELSDLELERMVEFASRGGSIVFVGPVLDPRLGFMQGFRADAELELDSLNKGFHLFEEGFPGMKNKDFDLPGLQPHYGVQSTDFTNNVATLAGTATDTEQPFITSRSLGLGEVITVNSFVVEGKIYRGILFSAILRGLASVPYQVANVSTIFLDDFPAPLYNEKLPPIDEEYNVTHANFVTKIWWPDMKALADSFSIDYAAMVAFNYNANVVPPFDFQEWRQGAVVFNENIVDGSIFLAKDIRDSRHELAFHGYNHFSLWMEDWDNINFMISALQAARKRWQVDNLGQLPTNYVPPTNNIDSTGLEAVIRGMPSIKYMSSLYLGEVEDGGGREFDPDPYVPAHIFNYPRITSGFNMDTNSLFNQKGMQLLTGIWTHFVHPDDVFQVVQRDEDDFSSRNPLGLGWQNSDEYGYGLYDLLSQRIKHTLYHFPQNNFVSATDGARITQDWRQSLTRYETRGNNLLIRSGYRSAYAPNVENGERSWFLYVPQEHANDVEEVLKAQQIETERSNLWNGFLYQIKTDKPTFFVPNIDPSLQYDPQFLNSLAADVKQRYQNYLQSAQLQQITEEDWRDTRLEDALRAWRRNPNSRSAEEQVISLSTEFGMMERAITILENRLLENENWAQEDTSRLITYYGWEGLQGRAELFLEKLWEVYQSQKVIDLKNLAVKRLGLFGENFERRWRQRELKLAPNDYVLLLNYTRSIESQENWPEMKENLRELLNMRPQTDSLYAYTIQRSIYYESPDSTLALVEEFPTQAYDQLTPFASNIALMYGFNANNYAQALFWAGNAPSFDRRLELFWISQLNLDALYKAKALDYLANNTDNAQIRSFVGTNLFYQGFTDEAYRILYPLFQQEEEQGFAADTLLRNEIGFLSYPQKKDFFYQYPEFFDDDQVDGLQRQYRENEGIRGQVFGEYRDDNFNNTFARGGISVQFGNRLRNTHLLKTEYLVFADDNPQTNETLQYQGLGYEYTHRSENQQLEFRAGSSVLFGQEDFIPEGLISVSLSRDSVFTSLQLTGGSELTSSSIQNDYYQAQLQLYRQDYWMKGNVLTTISANGKYYTNDVLRYGSFGRLYLDLMESNWKIRPLAEIGYSDATENYLTGIPYYTPDQYFSQGIGLDLQFRKPNTFDYRTQLTAEILGKHERRDGFFATGRVQLEHKFRNFWQISVGTEISTSSVYRSNRIFFTISHYFPRSLNRRKR
ncbi:MAG: hypothetical protein CL666_07280 [Balneola sp.]|nr:hypothetical protein [Balneola sp.]